MFGEQLLVAAVIVTIAPAAYAIWLLEQSDYWAGSLILVVWFPLFFAASNHDASQGHCAHLVEPFCDGCGTPGRDDRRI
jgi:hypothetical protein